jgi:hypothetical protein
MVIFAPSEIYICTYICCIYAYIYVYYSNFIEKHKLNFKSKLIRWLKVYKELFILLYMSYYFSHLSQFSFDINIHLTHNSVYNVVISIQTCNSKRTESSYKY